VKKIAVILLGLVVMVVVIYSMQDKESPAGYANDIEQEREKKELFMRTNEESPMKNSADGYKPLKYFPADLHYKVDAKLENIEDKKIRTLSSSDGVDKIYLEFGYAVFSLDGVDNRLLILEITEKGPYRGTLFLAFADNTSGKETYGAGRYLDLKKIPAMTAMTLDFNLAYNPYCAYSDKFSCPFPPPENVMKVAIAAGEKTWH
jgi:uncharacterized protein